MRSAAITLATLVAIAGPAVAAPLSLGAAGKAIGGGLLSGGAFAGLEALLEKLTGKDKAAPAARSLTSEEHEILGRGLAGILGKLAGATEEEISTVLKKALLGGAASGAAGAAISGLLGKGDDNKNQRRVSAAVAEEGAEVAGEAVEGLGSVLGKAVLGGVGSAVGGGLISEIEHLFNRTVTEIEARQLEAREPLSAVGKGLVGTGVSLGASALAGGVITKIEDEIKKLFSREIIELNELD